MLHRTVQQFLTDVFFGDLDILLLDMPPGTGDVAISVGQLLPHAEVLVVTTPQAAASDVAIRSGLVARQTGQRVAGVIENMAAMTLPDGTVLDLFGSGGGQAVAERAVRCRRTRARCSPRSRSARRSERTRMPASPWSPRIPAMPQPSPSHELAATLAAQPRGLAGRSLSVRSEPAERPAYVASESNGGVSPG